MHFLRDGSELSSKLIVGRDHEHLSTFVTREMTSDPTHTSKKGIAKFWKGDIRSQIQNIERETRHPKKIAFLKIAGASVIWKNAFGQKIIPWTFIERKTVGISWKIQSKHWPSWAERKNQGTVENNMLCRGKGIHRNGHHCWLRGKKRFRKA